ncbi:M3 family metallopeptidase [Rheinheimera baltica]|uniref:M3 family metallopeptidase n=1 Tax=Rheinheimera baltica TaxID=67576 RepID=UPI00273D0301|nr:M3 family metallopeptidase [Rheinheimera baltica]MDP5148433.1 M3 family metallopeptidase [Rheinheimera baltica]
MKLIPIWLGTALVSVSLLGCTDNSTPSSQQSTVATEQTTQSEQVNPLLQPWTGPYQGVPAFDKMKLADLTAALELGMAQHLADIDKITANPEAASFENTIVALEGVGEALDRVFTYYGIWSANQSSEEFRAIQREMAPKLSEFSSKITQNEALFKRIAAVYHSEQMQSLTSEQQRLTKLVYLGFANNGATLNEEQKKRYADINQRLAQLYTKFSNNVLADEEGYVLYLNAEQLGGLPDSLVKAAAAAATSRGKEGMYAITNTRSSMDPFLTYSTERELRKQVWNTYYSRGDNADEHDNNALIAEILALRDERVGLLGFDNYATWRLQDRMAKTPQRAMDLMMSVWPAAIARVQEEVADMQALAKQQGDDISIEPWDYRFYAEQVRKAKYDLNSDEVKQYLQLDKLREAMFYVAGRLFNFNFTPVAEGSVPVFHQDVKVWEVTDKTTGKHIGLWYLDPFARTGKRSGAWATSYRGYSKYDGVKNVLSSNNSNFIKGAPGEAVLISWDDAETYFHEFGHALHALSSNVTYPTLNGGVRDYTEFQSQLLERWLLTDEVINQFLVHHKTGEAMPAELVAKIKNAATFNEGFKTTEYLASAIIDLKLHMLDDPKGIDPDAFERDTLAAMGMPSQVVMRHRTPQFGHVFSGEGYAAAYYGYMWAEVLTSDAAEAFAQAPGGFYDKNVAAKLVEYLFSVRNALDPEEAYRAFRGRDAKIEALMRDRGFPLPSEQ